MNAGPPIPRGGGRDDCAPSRADLTDIRLGFKVSMLSNGTITNQ